MAETFTSTEQRCEMSEWQPIKTLPKDGRFVLVFRPLAALTNDESFKVVKTTKSPTVSLQGIKHWTSAWCHPTLWMEIPELPALSRHERDADK